MLKFHLIAFIAGFIIDCILGDPIGWPHPIRAIGNLISRFTAFFLAKAEKSQSGSDKKRKKRIYGTYMVVLVILIPAMITAVILAATYRIHPYLGVAVEAVMTYFYLAMKSLYVESMKVYKALKEQTLEDARYAVSMIVGRDTNKLNETGVAKAAIETVAENASDGVIAPMLYLAIGGPILGVIYKSINTMDSMVGYKNDKYMDFGRTAAHLDDVVNYIPARLSALFMVIACLFLGKEYSLKNAWKIHRRDRYKHASPNSAQTESTCAGALGIQLAGPASYFGLLVQKPYIGDPVRPVEVEDIVRANRLMIMVSIICMLLCVALIMLVSLVMGD